MTKNHATFVSFGNEKIQNGYAPISGDWNVNCADNCNWTYDQDVLANMSITGSGHLKLSANLTFTNSNQYIFMGSGCTFEIINGGAIK